MWRWLGRIALGLILVALVGAGVALRVTYLHYFPKIADAIGGPPASPPVLGPFGSDPPVVTLEDWKARRAPLLRAALAEDVFGALPPHLDEQVLARLALPTDGLPAGAKLQQLTVGFGAAGDRGKANVLLVQGTGRPRALIVIQNFCGNAVALNNRYKQAFSLAGTAKECRGVMEDLSHIILGKYPHAPPLKWILERGYAVAMVYAGDLVPDDHRTAPAALARLYGPSPQGPPGGALAAWAWLYSELGEVLTREPGLQGAPVIAWGHSRNGKAALWAAANDPNIAGVIAHQSGRGGASLTRSAMGESLGGITRNYGFWFTPRYATFAGREAEIPVDQHQLIALIAPRPVLIGSGDRDGWADPPGAFRAVQGASPIYQLYGAPAFTQTQLSQPDFSRPLAFYMRAGTHGVTTQDWGNFLQFLDAHFPARG
ncbi:hypothetical protein QO010_002115 [Caulobacter ginsengisoli]|uniref:4-O-methyl-glucuronoyl methylesterase-like domain-containing protein n=1 Tax=Caulobacter ginsengisoli TaxID=400775 RepID=A0ABU0IQP1_9CAUL|nr:hypothetical protein [Caulobacter ginsengisoli]MDQ0464334.1 hypothetical protein [Caulobacter ginsengisoli]